MNIHLVTAKYNSSVNAVAEFRRGIVHTIEEAKAWLNKINKPAMIYIDGMQDCYCFISLGCIFNSLYWAEYKKVID